jgi:hypothetical protein
MQIFFKLPELIKELVIARNNVRDHYKASGLPFTFDGNLIGDLGEALAAEIYGIKLTAPNGTGIDGHAPDGRSVQVKTSGRGLGPAFRMVDTRAFYLLVFHLDLVKCEAEVVFNGPEEHVINMLRTPWTGQQTISVRRLREANSEVPDNERLKPL